MPLQSDNNIKFKYLTFDELVINLDRLSRFKNPEESFYRVFSEIIFKCLITPKYSKNEIDNLSPEVISSIILKIWNESVKKLFGTKKKEINNLLENHINYAFKNYDERTKIFISTKLIITPILEKLDYNNIPINLKFLIQASKLNKMNDKNLDSIRKNFKLKFPIKKLLIVEGITEEILLPVFANKLGYNFDELGIYVLGAGGKSKSPSLYLKLKDKLKIPVILLFDADAIEICEILNKSLLKKDKTILINEGEFEDILPINTIKRALNAEYTPATPLQIQELRLKEKMCENIELFYKSRHLGEYKKSKVAKIIAENIKYSTDISEEIKNIIKMII